MPLIGDDEYREFERLRASLDEYKERFEATSRLGEHFAKAYERLKGQLTPEAKNRETEAMVNSYAETSVDDIHMLKPHVELVRNGDVEVERLRLANDQLQDERDRLEREVHRLRHQIQSGPSADVAREQEAIVADLKAERVELEANFMHVVSALRSLVNLL